MKSLKTIEIPIEFKSLFKDDWREASIYGGRFSLKSHTVARYLLIKAREKKTRVACFREFQNSIAESSHQLLSELIEKYGLKEFEVTNNGIVNKINGSDFLFKGLHNNEQSVKSTEGIDIAWVEEAQTVSNKSIEVLTPTIRKEGSKIVYTYNRLFDNDPVHKRLVIEGRPNTLVINVNYTDILKYGFIPNVILKEIEDDKKFRPALYKHKWLGEPNTQEIKIFSDWLFVDDIPVGARLERRWLDFGFTNDQSAIGEIWYANDMWWLRETLYRKGMKNDQLAAHLLAQDKNETLIIADSAEPKSIAEIASYGLNIVGVQKKVKGKPAEKTSYLKWSIQLVQRQPIAVVKSSRNIREEYDNYFWLQDLKTDRILNEEDPTCANHHMRGIAYALSTLAQIKQEASYWDRMFEEELKPPRKIQFNKGR